MPSIDEKIYLLMHKNIITAELTFRHGKCCHFNVLNYEHLPPFLKIKHCAKSMVDEWLDSRVVLPNRDRYERLKIMILDSDYSRFDWAIDNHALSLSDCYWIKNENENIDWSEINYYDNDFSNDLCDIFINNEISGNNKYKKLVGAGSTVTASLPKTWILKDGKRLLYKSGNQEIINEVFISNMLDKLHWEHIKYWRDSLFKCVCSVCETMSNNDVELITAYEFSHGFKKSNSPVRQWIDEISSLTDNVELDFSKMNLLDYITANIDRHWNNFGIIRNPDTLKVLSLAPIYDNGDTFWYNSPIIGCNVKNILYDATTLKFCNTDYFNKNEILDSLDYAMEVTEKGRFKNDFDTIYKCVVDRIENVFNGKSK